MADQYRGGIWDEIPSLVQEHEQEEGAYLSDEGINQTREYIFGFENPEEETGSKMEEDFDFLW